MSVPAFTGQYVAGLLATTFLTIAVASKLYEDYTGVGSRVWKMPDALVAFGCSFWAMAGLSSPNFSRHPNAIIILFVVSGATLLIACGMVWRAHVAVRSVRPMKLSSMAAAYAILVAALHVLLVVLWIALGKPDSLTVWKNMPYWASILLAVVAAVTFVIEKVKRRDTAGTSPDEDPRASSLH